MSMSKKTFQKSHRCITHTSEMNPIRPRRRIKYDKEIFNQFSVPEHIKRKEPDYALYHMDVKTCLSKRRINTRIVVIGASTLALSFLETLIYEYKSSIFINYLINDFMSFQANHPEIHGLLILHWYPHVVF